MWYDQTSFPIFDKHSGHMKMPNKFSNILYCLLSCFLKVLKYIAYCIISTSLLMPFKSFAPFLWKLLWFKISVYFFNTLLLYLFIYYFIEMKLFQMYHNVFLCYIIHIYKHREYSIWTFQQMLNIFKYFGALLNKIKYTLDCFSIHRSILLWFYRKSTLCFTDIFLQCTEDFTSFLWATGGKSTGLVKEAKDIF